MTIIELMIALTIFAVVTAGVAVAMGSALGLTRNNRNRSVAANLAAEEMDVVRSTNFTSLALTDVTKTRTVDGVNYSILRQTAWVSKDGTGGVCSPPAGTALAFLKVLVTVTWPNMQGVRPVTSETILAPPVGSYNSDLGHLSVRVRNRDAAPLNNIIVTIVGPGGTYTQTTSNGCVFFVGLTPGQFDVSLNTTNYVDGQGVQETHQEISVSAGSVTSAEFDYDQKATLNLTLVGLSNYKIPKNVGATVANTGLTLGTRYFPGGSSSGCTAQPTTVTSSADAMVFEGSKDSNYGTSGYFGVDPKSGDKTRVFVKFSLPTAPTGCALESATLEMYANYATAGRTLDAYQVNASWTETGITWNNQPAITGAAVGIASPSATGWAGWGVTSIVQAQYAGTNNGFMVRDRTEGTSSNFYNYFDPREATNDPRLVLTWAEAPPACAGTQVINPTDDARVRQSNPTTNYGNESSFRVRTEDVNKNERSYLKFTLPAIGSGCILSSATLGLYAESVQGPRTIEVYRANGAWTEGTITWNTQPGYTGSPSTKVVSATGNNDWDVLSLVQTMYSGTNDGFLMRDQVEESTSTKEQRFSSSENGTSSRWPKLTLVFTGDPALPTSQPVTATDLFPYLNGYQAWAGQCLDADPEGVNPNGGQPYYPGAQRASAVPSNPNATTAGTVQMKSVDVLVTSGGTPVPNASVQAYHDPDNGCPQGSVLSLGTTDASGYVRVGLPFGTWRFQVQNRTPSGSWPVPVLSPLTTDPQSVAVTVT